MKPNQFSLLIGCPDCGSLIYPTALAKRFHARRCEQTLAEIVEPGK